MNFGIRFKAIIDQITKYLFYLMLVLNRKKKTLEMRQTKETFEDLYTDSKLLKLHSRLGVLEVILGFVNLGCKIR